MPPIDETRDIRERLSRMEGYLIAPEVGLIPRVAALHELVSAQGRRLDSGDGAFVGLRASVAELTAGPNPAVRKEDCRHQHDNARSWIRTLLPPVIAAILTMVGARALALPSPVSDSLLGFTCPAETCAIPGMATPPPAVESRIPSGRGFWIWRVKQDPARLADSVASMHGTWVAVKAGNRGTPSANRDTSGEWRNQFTPALVAAFHARGIKVYGWGWDEPCCLDKQVKLVQSVYDTGADGYIVDAEMPWDRGQKQTAARYMARVRAAVPSWFILADAPWDVRHYHRQFPYDEFGRYSSFRSPQVYWEAHGINVYTSFWRYVDSWGVKGQVPSASAWGNVTPAQVAAFEMLARAAGMPGVLYWVRDSIPPDVYNWFVSHPW